jgi:putative transposase
MQRTRSLPDDQAERLLPLLTDYRDLLNDIIGDIWATIKWEMFPRTKSRKETSSVPMKQYRLIPHFQNDKQFKRLVREKHMEKWEYAAHWVDSAERAAFAIVQSWKKNYNKGERSRTRPRVTRLFAQIKQSLCKLEGSKLRITVKPHEFVWVDLSRRYFRLPKELSAFGMPSPRPAGALDDSRPQNVN